MEKSFYARYNVPVLAIVLFLLPFAIVGGIKAKQSNKNQVKDWLPPDLPANRAYRDFRKQFQGDEFILVSWEGCKLDLSDPEGKQDDQRLRMMCGKLDTPADPGLASDWLFKGEAVTGRRAIQQMSAAESETSADASTAVEPETSGRKKDKSPSRLSQQQAINRLTGWVIGPAQTGADPNSRTTCLVLKLSDVGRKNMPATVQKVKQAASECNISLSGLHMGGPPVDNVAIDQAGEERLYQLFGLSILIGVIVSWYSLRSWRLVALVIFAGVYSMQLSLALIYFTGQSVNAIVLTMPTLVYVATTSGAIHLANYYRDSIRDGIAAHKAPGHAIAHAWLPLSLATGTTAVGLLTLCYSKLVPIQMFGVYSAAGVVVSLLLLFLFMPAVLQMWPSRVARQVAGTNEHGDSLNPHNSRWWSVGEFIARHHALVGGACLTVMVGCGLGILHARTEVQLMKLFSPGAKILEDYAWLESNLGPLVPMEVVLHVDEGSQASFLDRLETVHNLQRSIESIDNVGATMSAATFVDLAVPKIRFFSPEHRREFYNDQLLQKYQAKALTGDYLRLATDPQTGRKQELYRISTRVNSKDVDYAEFITQLQAKVDPVIEAKEAAGITGLSVAYTGVMPLVYNAQHSLLNDLIFGFFTDFALIVVAMMIACRDWSAGPVLLIPSAFPAIVVFGCMGWTNTPLDMGSVMTPAVALGVTVDDIVHFMLWFRRGIAQGMDRVQAVMLAYQGCARAMYQSWGVIGIGLSVYMFSPFAPTQRFGFMMITLLTTALVGNLLLLPAVLAGPLGGIFAWGTRRKARRAAARTERRLTRAVAAITAHSESRVPEPHLKMDGARSGSRQMPKRGVGGH